MIAALIAAFGFTGAVSAQKDAAERAKEGGIDHWIEYYRGEQRNPVATPPREPVTSPVDRAAPAERTGPDGSSREKAERR